MVAEGGVGGYIEECGRYNKQTKETNKLGNKWRARAG